VALKGIAVFSGSAYVPPISPEIPRDSTFGSTRVITPVSCYTPFEQRRRFDRERPPVNVLAATGDRVQVALAFPQKNMASKGFLLRDFLFIKGYQKNILIFFFNLTLRHILATTRK